MCSYLTAVLQAGLGPAIALSACLPRQSGLLSLKNVWTSSSSAPSCGAAVHRAAVLQCCRPNTQCRVWSTCLIVWYRLAAAALCTIEYYLTRLYPLRKYNPIKTKYYPSYSCLPTFYCTSPFIYLLSSQSTSARHLPALSARCTDCTQAARRGRGSNQAAIGDLNAAAASHVQCCS